MNQNEIMNILVSFIIIGIIILLFSIENTLWALYWILFTLYLLVFFTIGLGMMDGVGDLIQTTAPIILMSFLITWLIQIFTSNNDLLQEDKMLRKLGEDGKIPNTFYNMYTGILLLMIVKIALFVGIIRNKLGTKENQPTSQKTLLVHLSIYGMCILSFLLLIGMTLVADRYITDG